MQAFSNRDLKTSNFKTLFFCQLHPLINSALAWLISRSSLTHLIQYFHFHKQRNWYNLTVVRCSIFIMYNDVAHFTVIRREMARCYNKVGRLGLIMYTKGSQHFSKLQSHRFSPINCCYKGSRPLYCSPSNDSLLDDWFLT